MPGFFTEDKIYKTSLLTMLEEHLPEIKSRLPSDYSNLSEKVQTAVLDSRQIILSPLKKSELDLSGYTAEQLSDSKGFCVLLSPGVKEL